MLRVNFYFVVGQVLESEQLAKVKQSHYWSLLLDETTDFSVCKQLILHVMYLDEKAESHVTFLGMLEVSCRGVRL